MTAVRVRHEFDAKSKYLADVPFAQLDTVIPTIQSWGVTTPTTDYPETMFGQFVYPETGEAAYFEVVISDGGESE